MELLQNKTLKGNPKTRIAIVKYKSASQSLSVQLTLILVFLFPRLRGFSLFLTYRSGNKILAKFLIYHPHIDTAVHLLYNSCKKECGVFVFVQSLVFWRGRYAHYLILPCTCIMKAPRRQI